MTSSMSLSTKLSYSTALPVVDFLSSLSALSHNEA
jgi:hypothetical protein